MKAESGFELQLEGSRPDPGLRPLRELPRRMGSYATYFASMLRHIRSEAPPGTEGKPPLAALNLEESGNWIIALLDAWARVVDVQAFYQQRILNEGYLGTASEALSVRELTRSLGHVPMPSLASSTDLVFIAAQGREMPEEVEIAAGARIDSLPATGRPSQTFETAEDLCAYATWNEVRLAWPRQRVVEEVTGATTSLVLGGLFSSLRPGDVMLLVTIGQHATTTGDLRILRTLAKVRSEPGPPGQARTIVSWEQPLNTGLPSVGSTDRLHAPKIFVFRRRSYLFGYNAPDWDRLPVEVRRRYQPIRGGVLVSRDQGAAWASYNGDRSDSVEGVTGRLPARPVNSLLVAPGGVLLAGTDEGVYRAAADGLWHSAAEGMRGRRVLSLAADAGTGDLFAGTDQGLVFRSVDGANTWEQLTGRGAVAPAGARRRSVVGGRGLRSLPRVPVRALAVVKQAGKTWRGKPRPKRSVLLAATDTGVFLSADPEGSWRTLDRGFPGVQVGTGFTALPVFALCSTGQAIYAGTGQGIFVRSSLGRLGRWQAFNEGLPEPPGPRRPSLRVNALVSLKDDTGRAHLLAGTDLGLFRCTVDLTKPTAGRWIEISPAAGLKPARVLDLAVLPGAGQGVAPGIWAGTDHGLRRVAGDHLVAEANLAMPVHALASRGRRLYAATPFDGFARGGWPDYGTEGQSHLDLSTVTQEIAPGSWIALFQPSVSQTGGAGVLAIHRAARIDTVQRQDFNLSSMVTRVELEKGAVLRAFDRRNTVVLFGSQPLRLGSEQQPIESEVSDTLYLPAVRPLLPEGRRLIVTGHPPGSPEDRLTRAVRVVACDESTEEEGDWTLKVKIEPPLNPPLEPSSVTIHGNVARVVQGETIQQILGSGDLSKRNQSFVLNRTPLTCLPAPWRPEGFESTLEVKVDGVIWQQVQSFLDAAPIDRCYTLTYDLENRPLITFGDGVHGARVPTGHSNVRAVYRSAGWTQPVEPYDLSVLRTQPAGLVGAFNPMPVPGGIPAETASQSRTLAPRRARCLGRIVTIQDLEDFTASYPGIEHALVTPLDDNHGTLHAVTVAAQSEESSGWADNELLRQLEATVGRVSVRGLRTWLSFEQRVRFALRMRLTVEPGAVATGVKRRVEEGLWQAFGVSASRFLATVSAYELSDVARRVSGVGEVELVEFQPSADLSLPKGAGVAPLFESLTAHPARIESPEVGVVPAQLLVLDSEELRLEVVER